MLYSQTEALRGPVEFRMWYIKNGFGEFLGFGPEDGCAYYGVCTEAHSFSSSSEAHEFIGIERLDSLDLEVVFIEKAS